MNSKGIVTKPHLKIPGCFHWSILKMRFWNSYWHLWVESDSPEGESCTTQRWNQDSVLFTMRNLERQCSIGGKEGRNSQFVKKIGEIKALEHGMNIERGLLWSIALYVLSFLKYNPRIILHQTTWNYHLCRIKFL